MDGSATRNIVLLGKTGSGKSSLANTIFGKTLFTVNDGFNSETKKCETKTKLVHGYDVSLIDTPGFFDTDMSEDDLRSEIVRCIVECAPGVHAFLIVLKWERFTEQEQAVIDKIKSDFSDEALKYAVLVFTHGDQLPKGKKIEDFISKNKAVSDLVKKCGGRCHVIDNEYWNEDSNKGARNKGDEYWTNRFQVKAILDTIDKMVTGNDGKVYTNKMLEEVERRIQQAIRQSSPSLSWKEIRNMAKEKVFEFLKYAAAITTGVLLGALLSVPEMIVQVVNVLIGKGPLEIARVAERATLIGGALVTGLFIAKGAIDGGKLGHNEAENAKTVAEAVKNTAVGCVKNLCEKTQNKFKQKESKDEKMHLVKKID
ncbi:GTPase IMAP family member 7-like [Cololabis saira]|uniref:GTPase IMAP family member 7-like n=1 Tax=Cololabis saira TaxID=129043 RepID=UPI002AD4AD0E|nr:GTPase IMAP family member 7-like [Cololabis saira]